MWVIRQDHDAQVAWVKAALADEDRREPLILAASMSQEVATVLASQALGPQADPAGALILADAAAEGAVLSADTRSALLTGLARAAAHPPENGPGDDCRDLPGEQPNRGTQTDSGAGPADRAWPYIRRAATLRLPPGLRNERRSSLAALELTGGQFVVATALAVLADARADCRVRLEPIDTAVVLQLLDSATYRNHKTLLPGHVTAAEQAISYLAQLGPGAPDAIFQIAAHGTYGLYRRVRVRLTDLGFTDQQARTAGRAIRRLFRGVPDRTEDWDQLFEAVVPVSDCRPLSHEEIWRLPDLAALCDVVDPLHATLTSIHDAYTVDRARLPGVLRAAARAAGIDLPTLSGQAAAALASWKTGDHGVADALLAPPPSPPAACLLTRLTQVDIDILIDALGVGSAWIADIAGYVLTQGRDQSIAEAVASRMPGNSPDSIRRRNTAIVVLANTADSAREADSMLNSADPSVRAGAAVASRLLAECGSGGPWEPVIARALADDDMTVRLACRDDADIRSAAFWSCPWCARVNDIAATACASCRRGKTLRADRLPRAVLHQKGPSAESPPQVSV